MSFATTSITCYFFQQTLPFRKLKLLASYCYSFYASALWDLSNPCIEDLRRTWRKGLRYALNLPVDASSKVLPKLAGTLPILMKMLEDLNVHHLLRMKFIINYVNKLHPHAEMQLLMELHG